MMLFTDDDAELDALLLACDPVDRAAVTDAAQSPAATTLRMAITDANAVATRRRGRRVAVIAGIAAAAVAIPLGVALLRPSSGEQAYGAELVRFAQNSPRLLVGVDGWRITRADEENADTGEMTFAAGARSLDVHWTPGATSKDTDKVDMVARGSATIAGHRAWVGDYGSGDASDFEAIWSDGDRAIDARGVFGSRAEFLAVAGTLHQVGVGDWLAALPDSVVKPASRAAAVDRMLADVPLPTNFDTAALKRSGQVSDEYQLGARVIGAVSCAWIHQWTVGDAAARREAATAMATSRTWAELRAMQATGAYPEVVWQLADALNGTPLPRPSGWTIEQWAEPALGC
jgi:hypothetical protein